jgi:hypothetical protein
MLSLTLNSTILSSDFHRCFAPHFGFSLIAVLSRGSGHLWISRVTSNVFPYMPPLIRRGVLTCAPIWIRHLPYPLSQPLIGRPFKTIRFAPFRYYESLLRLSDSLRLRKRGSALLIPISLWGRYDDATFGFTHVAACKFASHS